LLYNYEKFPKVGRKTSGSANKWIDREKYKSTAECFSSLREQGFKIYASSLKENSKNLFELKLDKPSAIVLGNEHRGISTEVEELADETFFIPMYGMVQSLNVSVAAAVILYEALRQRKIKGMYDECQLTDAEVQEMLKTWMHYK
jgi:tRNA (guanosine-2'-O-)-methyltransferase